MNLKPYIQIVRPANLMTAIADIFAGIAIAGLSVSLLDIDFVKVFLLIVSTKGLYAGGIVFNDIFDLALDKIERPERVIPSGKISLSSAIFYGIFLLISGISGAFFVHFLSGIIAVGIAIFALIYDKYGKHHSLLGPINMGICRGGNLLLGISIFPDAINEWYLLSLLPICYIAAITMISRGEVHGGDKKTLYFAGFLYLIVSFSQLGIAYHIGNLWTAMLFVFFHIYSVFKPLWKAIQEPIGANIGKAVKAGVLSLIIMDAAWVAVSGNLMYAVLILALLPISIRLAKIFAVT